MSDQLWLSGGEERKDLSDLFCAVLRTTIWHNHLHTRVSSSYSCWFRFRLSFRSVFFTRTCLFVSWLVRFLCVSLSF